MKAREMQYMHYDVNHWELSVGDHVKIHRQDQIYVIVKLTKERRALIRERGNFKLIDCVKLKWVY